MDQLKKWWLHLDSTPTLGLPTTPELQERVKAVILQGWAESTQATYGAGPLVYHIFYDSREVPEWEQALARAALITSFISALAGLLLGKAIHNYIYSKWAWHTLYGLPWVLHEEQIAMMLKGITKLVPSVLKQDKCKPVTIKMISRIKNTLDQANSFDAAFFTCLTTIFYTIAWVGKFTTKSLTSSTLQNERT